MWEYLIGKTDKNGKFIVYFKCYSITYARKVARRFPNLEIKKIMVDRD